MSDVRSYISADNILHVAVVARHRSFTLSWRRILILIILAIPVLIGLIDVLSRIAVLFDAKSAAASSDAAFESQSSLSTSEGATTTQPEAIIPAHIKIPSIGVDAPIEQVGLTSEGAMRAPSDFTSVGWYRDGSPPGAPGSAVFDGHVNNALTRAGVFEHLGQVQPGDEIIVTDDSQHTLTFTVEAIKTYPLDQAPVAEIFSRAGPPALAVITCDGVWDNARHEFSNRLVVYATRSN